MNREDAAAENRIKFPEIAEIVDRLRADGATVKLLYAENDKGEKVGRERAWGEE